jgi:hypothetical protein
VVQAINAGEEAGGTLNVNPNSFTNQGTLSVSNGEALNISGLSGNLGTATLSGSGSSLSLDGSGYTINRSLTATAGQALSLNGSWTNVAGANITATGATLSLYGAWTNVAGSTISATASTLNLGDQNNSGTNAWVNQGSILANNSTTNLGGSFSLAGLGSFQRSSGTVNLVGVLDANASGLVLNSTTGSWNLLGGTLKGGTYSASGGAELIFTDRGGALVGVTAASDLDLTNYNNANASIYNGLTLQKVTIHLGNVVGSTYGGLTFNGNQTLGGTGTVLFGKSGNNYVNAGYNTTLTIGSGITVAGSSGTLSGYYSNSAIINQGTISADDSGGQVPGFRYDTEFNGGNAGSTFDVIDTSGVTNPAPQAVYQTYRYGYNFSYALTGLTAGTSYTVRLDFADPGATAVGQRVFDVVANGTTVLSKFDIYKTAGVKDKAVAKTFTATADSSGTITLAFNQDSGGPALVNAIQVLSGSTVVQAINAGEEAGGTLNVNPNSFTNQGTLSVSNGEVVNLNVNSFSNSGTVQVTRGTLNITGATSNSGTVSVAAGSAINITGDYTQTGGTLGLDIAGTSSSLMGVMNISGTASLGGTLNVSFVNGFAPVAGDAFKVLTFGSRSGTFKTITTQGLPTGRTLIANYNSGDLTLTVS